MTEDDWLASTDSSEMLRFLIGAGPRSVEDQESFPRCRGGDRQLRLFACACYYRLGRHLPLVPALAAVQIAELFADGQAGAPELDWASTLVQEAGRELEPRWRAAQGQEWNDLRPMREAIGVALQVTRAEAQKAAYYAASNAYLSVGAELEWGETHQCASSLESRVQADLLRCIFGALFRTPVLQPTVLAWNQGSVVKIAERIYEEKAFADLPILADAL